MAYSNDQIYDAYQKSISQGFTPEQVQQGALANFGITADQYNSALAAYKPTGLIGTAMPSASQYTQNYVLNPKAAPGLNTVLNGYAAGNPANILASAGNLTVVNTPNGPMIVGNDNNGVALTQYGNVDAQGAATALVRSGLYQNPEQYKAVLNSLADQLDARGGAGGSDLRAIASGQLGANNWTYDPNAALKGPSGYGTLQQNQVYADLLGLQGANRDLLGYGDLSFLPGGLGEGAGGTAPVPQSALEAYAGGNILQGYEERLRQQGNYNVAANPLFDQTSGYYGNLDPTNPAYNPALAAAYQKASGGQAGATPATAAGGTPAPGLIDSALPKNLTQSNVNAAATAAPIPVLSPPAAAAGSPPGQAAPAGVTQGQAAPTTSSVNAAATAAPAGQVPSKISAPAIQAAQAAVDENQTVAGIINRLLGENSPYLQRAQALSLQQANERGLINSSIAAGAGTAAAIDAALGIATPDASIYSNTRLANLSAENNARTANAGMQLDADQFNAAAENELQRLATANGYDLNKMDVAQRQQLEQMAVQNVYSQQSQRLQSEIELQRLATANGYDLNKMDVAQRQQLEQLAAQNVYSQQSQKLAADLDLQRLAAANGYDLNRLSVQQAQQLQTLAVQQGYNRENVATQLKNQMSLNTQQSQLQSQQNAQQFGYQQELAKLQQTFGASSNTYSAATGIIAQGSQTINNILLDPNISNEGNPSPKQQLIDKVKENTRNQLAAVSAASSTDLSSVFK